MTKGLQGREIDLRFPGVGRLRRPWGTEHEGTRKKIKAMLHDLKEQGRLDILRNIRDGVLHPLQVYDAYRGRDLSRLPTAESMMPLKDTMTEWAKEYECSTVHRVNLHQSVRYLTRGAPAELTVGDLPRRLAQLRVKMSATPRSFNLTRSHVQAFARTKLGRNHPVWLDVTAVLPLKMPDRRQPKPLKPSELVDILAKLPAEHRVIAKGMALTGMGPKEFWTDGWETQTDRVRIHGAKRGGRDRFVPRIALIEKPIRLYPAFRQQFVKAAPGVQVYDLRRTFANWMEAAMIPRTRRRIYRGHGAQDIGDLYEEHEVAEFLAEDAERLKAYLRRSGGESLVEE